MANAIKATIDPAEAKHFGTLAADWWNPKGSSAMLHRLNPPRLAFLREQIDAHWGGDPAGFTPLAGKSAVDVGCGAGLLAEPLARMGAKVTGVDAAPENVGAAAAHAAQSGLDIDYIAGGIEDLAGRQFDLVTSMEVIEHVADPAAFVSGLAGALAPGGLMVLSTPNRTALSRLAMITVGEGTGMIPRGTHDWSRFLKPEELEPLLEDAGLKVIARTGLSFTPGHGFVTGGNETLNYLLAAVAA
ncbi:bifunctional 2-polyprenyl-6-hydroxyphenol methylase/3-demethylubiquinol 3-O-methyltransferase UbiG [Stakelama tenebrarum]|uniref:Ubiquinone biosynthesis O-methyltransferase n=1 Tax=Stakelama tenebrarum TaxID=2711215 RepID=A0A6G6Y1H8_9SPHN|nr:bifunctional 2-polyprenyl-6-hydroxyphenol methylase/3-demethylubiquinol 3-O-methyltransferase UbiG [Sphingosinithalassobacter tenebrarum]QIG78691.1 bifunctional 2-polyprenyl-6-hydroxyphenol methylase/3-demethylubiquinol 3-O-methyltransferase UbiG [Sphingosinithalassobacter tenebrarum]